MSLLLSSYDELVELALMEYGDDEANESIEVRHLLLVWVCIIFLFYFIVKLPDEKVGNLID